MIIWKTFYMNVCFFFIYTRHIFTLDIIFLNENLYVYLKRSPIMANNIKRSMPG